MDAPLSVFTGAWFTLFGAGVLGWCALEIRTRRELRRTGVSCLARVLPDPAARPATDGARDAARGDAPEVSDTSPVLGYLVEGHGEVVTRPRGWTSVRRTPPFAVDTLVPVRYDPARPTVVAVDGAGQLRGDAFWTLLGLAFAACGVLLLLGFFR
ncbi:DUF3592 domain-containing protein [Streptacidiphilus sp. N1-3]|uniref:DUF3592 domain-containing protein n=1 Tax=Streptacidiphilus alkalitolerans TaxID=3342712 RepID=A0ABV6WZA3_9ACTN